MDISNLNLTKSAQVFLINKKLSKNCIESFFKSLKKEGNFLLKEIQTETTTSTGIKAKYSIVVYKSYDEPSFLINTNLLETKYCFNILIEIDNSLVVYKKNSESPETKLSRYVVEYEYNKLCHFKGNDSPDYEKVSMNNMSLSNAVVRSRSYEAFRLNGIISNLTTSRAIPRNFRMKVKDEIYTLTPNTCKISLKDKKRSLDEIINWSKDLINEVNASSKSEFISNFANPVKLQDILSKKITVTAIFVGLSDLEEDVYSANSTKSLTVDGISINNKVSKRLFGFFRRCLNIRSNNYVGTAFKKHIQIQLNKKSITIKSKLLDQITVQDNNTGENLSLTKYINNNKLLSAVFSDPQYSYWASNCFEDKKLMNNLDNFLGYLHDNYNFNGVQSEKEKGNGYPNSLNEFPGKSLFSKIEKYFDNNNSIVICDDMGDEWADHIIIDSNPTQPSLSFIHEKFTKKDSSGAGAFHEVVSQALKNIGRPHESISAYKYKYDNKWKKNYENTQIKRIKNNDNWTDIKTALEKINSSTSTVRKVILATPFLDKNKIKKEFTRYNTIPNSKLKPYHVQLIWLLSTLISVCQDQGIRPMVLCKYTPKKPSAIQNKSSPSV